MRLLLILFVWSALSTFASAQNTRVYDACAGEQVISGDVAALVVDEMGQICWRKIDNGERIDAEDLAVFGSRDRYHQFIIVFAPNETEVRYDAIYGVTAERRARQPVGLSGLEIELIRGAIETFCRGARFAEGQNTVPAYNSGAQTAQQYTRFHSTPDRVLRPTTTQLERFHIYFRNELEECARTDETAELRSRFLFEERGFVNVGAVAQFLSAIGLATSTAQATGMSEYDEFTVRIREGSRGVNFVRGLFRVDAGHSYRITVSDLASRVSQRGAQRYGRLRYGPVQFQIVHQSSE